MRVSEVNTREPNAGHRALARIEEYFDNSVRGFDLLTQNVDGFHQIAGSQRVVELRGTLHTWRCTNCGTTLRHPGSPFEVHPPICKECGPGLLRPGVVWFGEHRPNTALEKSFAALESCDALLAIGTSAVVYPAAGFAETVRERGGTVCELNTSDTPLTEMAEVVVRAPAAQSLPLVYERLTS